MSLENSAALIRIRAAAWGSALLLALAVLSPAAAQEETCAACHEVEIAAESIHSGFGCLDCHSEYDEDSHPEEMTPGEEACAVCHDVGDTLEASVHAGLAGCQDCHGTAHGILPATELRAPTSPLEQPKTCGECHGGETIDGYIGGVHGRALLRAGLVNAPSCSSCHGAHDILPAADPEARIAHEKSPETCGTCHLYVLQTWREESAHGQAWVANDDRGPVCTTCHSSHELMRPTLPDERLGLPETCGGCHDDYYKTYRHSFHGKVTDLGMSAAAICSDCHTPHRNLAASDPRSSIHPDNLAETCGACHGEAPAAFYAFDPHNDPSNPEDNRAVYLVWFFMTALLISVFGFFGLHDLLWLQRAIVELKQGRLASTRSFEGPWVKRFPKSAVWTHVVVVISFLALAATGLPLKFHYASWAQAINAVPGAIEAMRLIHRVAAVFTFGYAFFHIAMLFRRSVVEGKRGIFWGWRSMVPRRKDLEDLWANLRYFLYMGPKPPIDRWGYWEKFDYFAVFWGVPIIGGSGLMLWFPKFFTSFLPGWVINAALVVHSDEALLATGFIFVFHFFHTHVRPESFPLDPVIFVGSMPLEKFKEERPLEYERLVKDGELESRIVDPPSEPRLRLAYGFGLIAVSAGVLLAIAIFASLLAH